MSILIENVQTRDRNAADLYIEDNRIERIGNIPDEIKQQADTVLDGTNKLAVPSLMNGHTHSAMTLFRGWGDDLPLETWLNEKIWPAEANLTPEDVYWGTRLACLEMIKTGTTFFNDMYWHFSSICDAVEDSGLRATVSGVFIDQFDPDKAAEQKDQNQEYAEKIEEYPDRIQFALGPHSVYTVSEDSLSWAAEYTRTQDLPLHIHLAETEEHVQQCNEQHGCSPVEYLEQLGALHERTVAAHVIWVDNDDLDRLAENQVQVVHNPIANYKLASGMEFRYDAMKQAGIPVCLGTDGVASNNNYDLFEEIKMSALIQKSIQDNPSAVPAEETFSLATETPAQIFDLPCGEIKEGALADVILLDRTHPSMQPLHSIPSQLAYAASGGIVDTTICNGRVLMKNGDVEDEKTVRKNACRCAKRIVNATT